MTWDELKDALRADMRRAGVIIDEKCVEATAAACEGEDDAHTRRKLAKATGMAAKLKAFVDKSDGKVEDREMTMDLGEFDED